MMPEPETNRVRDIIIFRCVCSFRVSWFRFGMESSINLESAFDHTRRELAMPFAHDRQGDCFLHLLAFWEWVDKFAVVTLH